VTERRTVVLRRTYTASAPEVWEMWTTSDGIESWWGPDGFAVEVHDIDVSPGGRMSYSMKAVGSEQIAYMEEAGMPVVTTHTVTYAEVSPYRRLSYQHLVDFVPGVETYEVGTMIELRPEGGGTLVTLTLDAMHDQHWTDLAVAGWENELDRLNRALETRKERS
jgi:uncharacterized protein YndB with AHSA1/START domain